MAKKLPPVSVKGYTLDGSGPIIVLFHGLTGSPYDLLPIALFLNRQGCEVRVPLLQGHGSKSADLQGVTEKNWLSQAHKVLDSLDKTRPMVLGGLSMGALIAIVLASTYKTRALLLLSPALQLSFGAEITITGLELGIVPQEKSMPKLGGSSDIADPIAKKKCPSYGEVPLFGLLQLAILRKNARKLLSELDVPIFAAFGRLDGAIDTKVSRNALLDSAQGPLTSKVYSRSKHVVSLDYDRDILAKDIWHFLTLYLG